VLLQIRCTTACGFSDVCANCSRKAQHPDPVLSIQVLSSYGVIALRGCDETGLGEILRNLCTPVSRFIDCLMCCKSFRPAGFCSAAVSPLIVWVRIQSRIVGIPVDSQCSAEVIRRTLMSRTSLKETTYRLFFNGKSLQVLPRVVHHPRPH
jgi:hypothetical protein